MARASQVLLLTSTLMLTCWTGLSMAFSTGAPASTCSSMAPSHGSSKSQAGSQGCMLAFSGSVQEGRSQTLSLTCGGNPFKGFIVQCRTGDENGAAVGEFTAAGTHTAHRSCNAGQNNAVTHTSGAAKTQVELGWTPDQTACQADIQCRATVVFQYATFTTHVRAASTRCAAAPVASTKPAPAEQPTPAEVFSAMPDSASGEITEDAGNSNPTLGSGSQEGEVLSPMSVPSPMDDESDEQIIQDVQGAIVQSPEDAGNSNPTLGSGSQEGEVLSPMSVPSSMDDESDAQIIQDMQGAIEKSPAEQPTPAVIFSAMPGSGSQEGEVLSPMSVPSSMDDESDEQIIQDVQRAVAKSPVRSPVGASDDGDAGDEAAEGLFAGSDGAATQTKPALSDPLAEVGPAATASSSDEMPADIGSAANPPQPKSTPRQPTAADADDDSDELDAELEALFGTDGDADTDADSTSAAGADDDSDDFYADLDAVFGTDADADTDVDSEDFGADLDAVFGTDADSTPAADADVDSEDFGADLVAVFGTDAASTPEEPLTVASDSTSSTPSIKLRPEALLAGEEFGANHSKAPSRYNIGGICGAIVWLFMPLVITTLVNY